MLEATRAAEDAVRGWWDRLDHNTTAVLGESYLATLLLCGIHYPSTEVWEDSVWRLAAALRSVGVLLDELLRAPSLTVAEQMLGQAAADLEAVYRQITESSPTEYSAGHPRLTTEFPLQEVPRTLAIELGRRTDRFLLCCKPIKG